MMEISLENGKYLYQSDDTGFQTVRRYGEPWRDLTGDKFVHCMAYKIEQLRARVKELERPVAEPVAYLHTMYSGEALSFFGESSDNSARKDWIRCAPLYRAPPDTEALRQRVKELEDERLGVIDQSNMHHLWLERPKEELLDALRFQGATTTALLKETAAQAKKIADYRKQEDSIFAEYNRVCSLAEKQAEQIKQLEDERETLIIAVADHVTVRGEQAEQIKAAREAIDNSEQRVFEDWLRHNTPSGDVESVQCQWEQSAEFADFRADFGDALAKLEETK